MIKRIISKLDSQKVEAILDRKATVDNEEYSLVVSKGFFNRNKGEKVDDRNSFISRIYSGEEQYRLVNTTKGLIVEKTTLTNTTDNGIYEYKVERYRYAA